MIFFVALYCILKNPHIMENFQHTCILVKIKLMTITYYQIIMSNIID